MPRGSTKPSIADCVGSDAAVTGRPTWLPQSTRRPVDTPASDRRAGCFTRPRARSGGLFHRPRVALNGGAHSPPAVNLPAGTPVQTIRPGEGGHHARGDTAHLCRRPFACAALT